MIVKICSLDMNPVAVPFVIHLSQYDENVRLAFPLYTSYGDLDIKAGQTAMLRGKAADGTEVEVKMQLIGEQEDVTVLCDISKKMTQMPGRGIYEVTLYDDRKQLSSSNFIILVEHAPF